MRQSVAAFALIRRQSEGHTLWLSQWNRNWNRFNFVGGHQRPGESFRQCAIREVEEELRIVEGQDYHVSDKPLAYLEYVAWSQAANDQTAYTVELFDVRLLHDEVQRRIDSQRENRWLTETEILAQKSSDGLAVSETMSLLLTQAKLWTAEAGSPDTRPPELFLFQGNTTCEKKGTP